MMQSWLLHIVYGAFTDNAAHAERTNKMLRSLIDVSPRIQLLKGPFPRKQATDLN